MASKQLRKLSSKKVAIFKIANRKGFAAICQKNLTEGRTPLQAFQRMVKAVKRHGFQLNGNPPKAK